MARAKGVVLVKSSKVPEGWEYWCSGGRDYDDAWQVAFDLKRERDRLRPDLLCRVRVVKAPGGYWVLRRDEPRVKEKAA